MQLVHASAPLELLYFPATQTVQPLGEPASTNVPALQADVNDEHAPAPAALVVPLGQGRHAAKEAPVGLGLKVLGGHGDGALAPIEQKLPAEHDVHDSADGPAALPL